MGREAGTRIRVSLRTESEPSPEREEIPRIVRLLALAHRWHRQLDEGVYESQAEIAAAVGLTRARVTQIMDLRWMAPALQRRLTNASFGGSPIEAAPTKWASWIVGGSRHRHGSVTKPDV